MSCTKPGYMSVFGEAPKTTYIYADIVKDKLKRKRLRISIYKR